MTGADFAKITCVADADIAPLVDQALEDLAIPEAFIQRSKQGTLVDQSGIFGLRPTTVLEERRSRLYRFYVPRGYETGVLRRLADSADLALPGRGSAFSEDVRVFRGGGPMPDYSRLKSLIAEEQRHAARHELLCCIVRRGMAEPLIRTILEMGLCVPIVSFGVGMGLRNKLGLLRITIPVDKEVIYLIAPAHDAELLESVAVGKARLDRPGQGFIYRTRIFAGAVNLRVRIGARRYAATMEQVISVLDDLRGSSEWRRSAPVRRSSGAEPHPRGKLVCLSLTGEEGAVGDYVRAAMDAGAGGATLLPLEHRSYGTSVHPRLSSHARETCDLIVESEIADAVLSAVGSLGLFRDGSSGLAELSPVGKAVTYRG